MASNSAIAISLTVNFEIEVFTLENVTDEHAAIAISGIAYFAI